MNQAELKAANELKAELEKATKHVEQVKILHKNHNQVKLLSSRLEYTNSHYQKDILDRVDLQSELFNTEDFLTLYLLRAEQKLSRLQSEFDSM